MWGGDDKAGCHERLLSARLVLEGNKFASGPGCRCSGSQSLTRTALGVINSVVSCQDNEMTCLLNMAVDFYRHPIFGFRRSYADVHLSRTVKSVSIGRLAYPERWSSDICNRWIFSDIISLHPCESKHKWSIWEDSPNLSNNIAHIQLERWQVVARCSNREGR